MLYKDLATIYYELESTSKRLKKTSIIANFLKNVSDDEIEHITYLLQGLIFPLWDERKIGFSTQLMIKAISSSTGSSRKEVENLWEKTGDLGLVAESLIKTKLQRTLFSKKLTTKKVFENLRVLASLEGEGTVNRKISLVSELLTSASPLEAKYITRTVLDQLRTGVAEGTIRDAIVWAYFPKLENLHPEDYNKLKDGKKIKIASLNELNDYEGYKTIEAPDEKTAREIYNFFIQKVQTAYDLCNDFSLITKILVNRGIKALDKIEIKIGNPIQVMLPIRIESLASAFENFGGKIQLEQKFDGFRVQVHYDGKEFSLFTRRLENVTKQFSELLPILKKHVHAKNYILDTEVVGYDKKTHIYLPFQNISKRIKRKYDIKKISKEVPVEINVFDVIYCNDKNLMNIPLDERRRLLEGIIEDSRLKIKKSPSIIASSLEEAEDFYKRCLKAGLEGVVIKKIDSNYKPGRYVEGWEKLKPVLETLDLVIVKAEWGEGKRSKWLSSFTVACHDKGKFLEIGKVSTGLKEKNEEGLSFEEMTKLLKPLIISQKGKEVIVKPSIIIEVAFEEIQRSPKSSSEFSMRFPRVRRLRIDKGLDDVSSIELVSNIYKSQKGKNKQFSS